MNMQLNSDSKNSSPDIQELTLSDFQRILGFDFRQPKILDLESLDLAYRVVIGEERDRSILEMINRLSVPSEESGPHRLASWEKGWKENLDRVKSEGVSKQSLQPAYCHYRRYRLEGNVIESTNPAFETDVNTVIRPIIFERFLSSCSQIIEFGSGTGTSLMILSNLFKDKEIWGSDWTQSSVDLCNLLAERESRSFRAFRFDMFNPELPQDLDVNQNTAFITMHSMEQLADKFGSFLDFICQKNPGICVHLEPIAENYDPNNLLDHLALAYHHKRKYLNGFQSAVTELSHQGRAKIIYQKRLTFGSLFHEGYSLLVWKPTVQ